jgi:hypothetical protein
MSPKGSQIVAGGRSEAQTTDEGEGDRHSEGVQETSRLTSIFS